MGYAFNIPCIPRSNLGLKRVLNSFIDEYKLFSGQKGRNISSDILRIIRDAAQHYHCALCMRRLV